MAPRKIKQNERVAQISNEGGGLVALIRQVIPSSLLIYPSKESKPLLPSLDLETWAQMPSGQSMFFPLTPYHSYLLLLHHR
jgi:hypothetical protein